MIRLACVFLVSVTCLFNSDATASLMEGKDVGYQYLFPDVSTPIFGDIFTVGPGDELPNLWGDPNLGRGTVDVSDKNITIDFYADSFFTSADFNGFRIFDVFGTIDAFTSVTINAATNMVGFSAANVSFDADFIYVNWQGLDFTTDTIVSIDVNGGNVPEPATVIVWCGLGLAAAGTVWTKKRAAAQSHA